jgi:hypothetical protein
MMVDMVLLTVLPASLHGCLCRGASSLDALSAGSGCAQVVSGKVDGTVGSKVAAAAIHVLK